jgi:hypothetical protein
MASIAKAAAAKLGSAFKQSYSKPASPAFMKGAAVATVVASTVLGAKGAKAALDVRTLGNPNPLFVTSKALKKALE